MMKTSQIPASVGAPSNLAKVVFRQFFLLLVFVSIFLPSGIILGVNVKYFILFVVLLALMLSRVAVRMSWVLVWLAFTIMLGSWLLYGIFLRSGEFALALLQFKDIYVTFLIPFIGWIAVRRAMVNPYAILMSGAYAASAVGLVKIALEWISWGYEIHFMALVLPLESFFNVQIMTMSIIDGVFRIQIPSDISIPFLLFFLMEAKQSGLRVVRLKFWIIIFLIIMSGFLAFSRYIWVATLVLLILWMFSRRQNIRSSVLFFLSVIVVAAIFMVPISNIMSQRFSSEQVATSDQVRIEQLQDLTNEATLNPWVGFGLGAYIPNNVRDEKLKYSYELQWSAWLVQLGVLGSGALFVTSLMVLWPTLKSGRLRPIILLVLAFALWLGSALTNPYLTSSFAGVVFLFFLIYGSTLSRNHNLAPVTYG